MRQETQRTEVLKAEILINRKILPKGTKSNALYIKNNTAYEGKHMFTHWACQDPVNI